MHRMDGGTAHRAYIIFLSGLGAGGSPAATHFSCFAKKSKQKKATRGSSPRKNAGYPALLETTGRCGTRARRVAAQKASNVLALRQSSRNAPVVSALLGDSHRDPVAFSPPSLSSMPKSVLTLKELGFPYARERRKSHTRSSNNGRGPHARSRAAEQTREMSARTV